MKPSCLAQVVCTLLTLVGCADQIDGLYIDCPRPAYSQIQALLHNGNASYYVYSDGTGTHWELDGTYSRTADVVRFEFTQSPDPEEFEVSSDDPFIIEQSLIRAGGVLALGPWISWGLSSSPKPGGIESALVRVGGPHVEPPAEFTCPSFLTEFGRPIPN